jgi:drug/metabolite transporter (DMT)-like permease
VFVVSLLVAAVAAGCNAAASVLQRKANLIGSPDERLTIRTAAHVLRRPAWQWGFIAMLSSFALQATALGIGELSAVEPVLVIELPLTLLLASHVFRHPLRPRDWCGIAAMTAGLAALVGALAPSGGDAVDVPLTTTLPAVFATAGGVGALWLGALAVHGRARPVLFGIAAGSGFGLTASLIKAAVGIVGVDGLGAAVRSWQPYTLAAAGVLSVWLVQNALHSGTLVDAQPGITLLDPIVSVLWGVLVYGEAVNQGPLLAVAVLGVASIVVGALVQVRAPAFDPSRDRAAAQSAERAHR